MKLTCQETVKDVFPMRLRTPVPKRVSCKCEGRLWATSHYPWCPPEENRELHRPVNSDYIMSLLLCMSGLNALGLGDACDD